MKVLSEFGRSSREIRRARLAERPAPAFFSRPASYKAAKGSIFARRLRQTYPYFALAGLACLLGAGLILECYEISAAHGDTANTAPPPDTKTDIQTMRAGFPEQGAVEAWSSVTLARPLFNAHRTPPQAIMQAAAQPPLPRLAGIIITSSKQLAIICGANGGPVILKKGDRLGRYEISSIAADDIRLDSPSGVQTLHIAYGGPAPGNPIPAPLKTHGARETTGAISWPIPFERAKP